MSPRTNKLVEIAGFLLNLILKYSIIRQHRTRYQKESKERDIMRLHEVILKNFRGYYGETRIAISDLTALIGKNDVGKSTILEALDIFFNQSKIDATDKNIFHVDEETVIGCVFNDLPAEIALENATTSFSKEYLLNQEGNLEVLKKYSSNGKPTIWICANHPSNDGFNDGTFRKK